MDWATRNCNLELDRYTKLSLLTWWVFTWLSLLSRGEFALAQLSPSVLAPVRAVAKTRLDEGIVAMRKSWKYESATPLDDDLRTLATRQEGDWRRRYYQDVVGLMHGEEFALEEFPLEGTVRSTDWWVRILKRSSLTPLIRHNTWPDQSKVDEGNRVTHEHSTLREALEAMACIDQLNLFSFVCAEVVVRRVQLLGEGYGPSGGSVFNFSDTWMGAGRRNGGMLVNSRSQRHVASVQGERNSVAKERRTVAEERRFGRKVGEKGDNVGKGDDEGAS